ncbi:MAG TPA: hypothetical protein VJ840_09180 [Gemmatimonadaceae bacterium]|nr:hypothetical protein [Gemmatimonadaceae bacterium]
MVLRIVAVIFALFVCFALGSGIAMHGIVQPRTDSVSPTAAAMILLVVCVLESLVISYLIVRSRWSGWKLIVAIFFIFYGVTTFMPQIESAVFITQLPAGVLPRLFLMGLLIAVPFSFLAVWILGKRRSATMPAPDGFRPEIWKVALIALVYVILYFTFGYFIAWRTPAVAQYYAGSDPGSFLGQMQSVMRNTPWLIPFQVLRALCWVAIAVPIIRMLKGGRQEVAIALALTFSVLMNAQLLLPNPYMPTSVRMAHLVETASSNFLFGLFVGWLLTKKRTPVQASFFPT